MSTEQTLPADIQNQLAAMQQTTLHPHDWRVLERLIAQRLAEVTRHLTEAQERQAKWSPWAELKAAEATIATVKTLSEQWRYNAKATKSNADNEKIPALDRRQCYGVSQAYEHCANVLDAALAAPAAPAETEDAWVARWCGLDEATRQRVMLRLYPYGLAAPAAVSVSTDVEIIVNGQPVTVAAGPIRQAIAAAIEKAGQIGAPIDQWVLRTTDGEIIPHALPDGMEYAVVGGQRLWLHLGLPPLAASAAGTPEVAVLGSQGEPGTNGLTPLPGAATLCACVGTRSVEDVPVIGGGEETRCLDCGRAVWAAGTPAKEGA